MGFGPVRGDSPFRIVILGGGTAGWMTACFLAHHWRDKNVAITVIESPEIGIIGVGEGSTPQLKAFFSHLGIAEQEWMPACDATYKIGIRFHGWSERPGFESYFHPFPGPLDVHSQSQFFRNCQLLRAGFDVSAHPDQFYLSPLLADQGKGPIPADNFPFDLSYGYHFDAHKVGAFLRSHAERLGVTHLERKVGRAQVDDIGAIVALECEDGDTLLGDFFVDCSGFRALLAKQTLGASFLPFSNNLFNDRAVVMPTPHQDGAPLPVATGSTAMSNGWRWTIPLTSRIGNGYVYSSGYCDPDAAETELRSALGMLDSDIPARHLQMKVGRLENSWTGNCLAMGLAQGFIEPLEATALHIVIATLQEFVAAMDGDSLGPAHRNEFNRRIGERYEGIRDYIVAHYRMNQRTDTAYWRDNAANQNLSDPLKAMMTAWFTGKDIEAEIAKLGIDQYYSAISWHCLFAGYGTFPAAQKLRPLPGGEQPAHAEKIGDFLSRASLNFSDHRECLGYANAVV